MSKSTITASTRTVSECHDFQENVTQTTKGYNYLSIGNDIYLYTGVTSANADESNLGFILENMRTGEITKYSLASATEESARESAEGAVQEKSYKATFPILINLNDKPLYIMGLKDNAGLVKEYALVDAVEYQNVIVATTVEELLSKYANKTTLKLTMQPQKASRVWWQTSNQLLSRATPSTSLKLMARFTRSRPLYQMTFLTLKMVKLSKVK